jgi:phage terminase large subunit-like protein
LSSSRDLSALAVVARGDADDWLVWVRQYCPRDAIRKRGATGFPYLEWLESGDLIATEGNVIDQNRIFDDLVELCAEVDVRMIAVYRRDATAFMTRLMEKGLPVTQFGQGFSSMTAPMKEVGRAILGQRFRHGGNPLLRWNFANVRPDVDAAGNIKPNKSRNQETKIDGAVLQ